MGSGVFPSFQSGSHTDSSNRTPHTYAHFRTRKPYSIYKDSEIFRRTDQDRSISTHSRPQAGTYTTAHRVYSPRIPLFQSFRIENELGFRISTLVIHFICQFYEDTLRNKKGLDTDTLNRTPTPARVLGTLTYPSFLSALFSSALL